MILDVERFRLEVFGFRRAGRAVVAGALACAALLPPSALAAAPTYGLALGAGEYMNLPGPPVHAGTYASLGLWAAFDLKRVTLIPQVAVEAAPETGQWGFMPMFTADFPVHKRLGLDITAMLMHNQTGGDWSRAEVLLGGGPGVSVFLGPWTVSPNALFLYNFMAGGWAFFPGVGLSRAFQ